MTATAVDNAFAKIADVRAKYPRGLWGMSRYKTPPRYIAAPKCLRAYIGTYKHYTVLLRAYDGYAMFDVTYFNKENQAVRHVLAEPQFKAFLDTLHNDS